MSYGGWCHYLKAYELHSMLCSESVTLNDLQYWKMKKDCEFKEGLKRGAWTSEENELLSEYIRVHGTGKWRSLPANAGLNRCGKSCRLRWLNYLRPDIKRGNITEDEEELIIRLHKLLGNKWSLIAGRLPGRTDNEIKNYWNTYLKKKVTGETSCQRSSSTVKTAFPEKQTEKKKEKSGTNVTSAKTLKCTRSIVENQIPVSTMKPSPKNVSETQTDLTFNFARHYDPQLNTTKDDVWITELMQNSDFHLPSKESSYTSHESLHNIYGNETSFNEEIYIRGLFNSGKVEEGTCIFS